MCTRSPTWRRGSISLFFYLLDYYYVTTPLTPMSSPASQRKSTQAILPSLNAADSAASLNLNDTGEICAHVKPSGAVTDIPPAPRAGRYIRRRCPPSHRQEIGSPLPQIGELSPPLGEDNSPPRDAAVTKYTVRARATYPPAPTFPRSCYNTFPRPVIWGVPQSLPPPPAAPMRSDIDAGNPKAKASFTLIHLPFGRQNPCKSEDTR